MKTNRQRLIMMSVQGKVAPPVKRSSYTVKHDGEAQILPGVGGITYNVKIGDPAMDWVGDHVEPGVSSNIDSDKSATKNNAYNILACIGNQARMISGEAEGEEGFVTGKHGGIEHVLLYFDDQALEEMAIGDKILIKAIGQGLAIEELPEVKVMNLDPDLLDKMKLRIEDGQLQVPVRAIVPPELMGSGLGAYTAQRGDYDITTADQGTLKKHGLDQLAFGDLVALKDADNSYGRCYREGAISIGIVVHSNCILAGHGPGVTTIFSSPEGRITPIINSEANLTNYLEID